MSAFNASVYNYQPFNAPGAIVALPRPLAVDARTIAPAVFDVRSIAVAKLDAVIYKLVAGDTWKLIRTYTGLQTGVTISKVYWTVKADPAQADAAAMFQKTITTAATASGQITDASTADGTITLNVIAAKSETVQLTPGQEYYYDLQGITTDGAVYTFETGTITPAQGVTTASS